MVLFDGMKPCVSGGVMVASSWDTRMPGVTVTANGIERKICAVASHESTAFTTSVVWPMTALAASVATGTVTVHVEKLKPVLVASTPSASTWRMASPCWCCAVPVTTRSLSSGVCGVVNCAVPTICAMDLSAGHLGVLGGVSQPVSSSAKLAMSVLNMVVLDYLGNSELFLLVARRKKSGDTLITTPKPLAKPCCVGTLPSTVGPPSTAPCESCVTRRPTQVSATEK